jgi:hypothetical protein
MLRETVPTTKLADYIGKDLAEKAVHDLDGKEVGESVEFSGLDLKVGGEQMRTFYDKIVVNTTNKILKQLGGGRVGTVDLTPQQFAPSNEELVRTGQWLAPGTMQEGGNAPGIQPAFDITPALQESALQGLPLFQNPRAPRGAYQMDPEGLGRRLGTGVKPLIRIFQNANPSTALHELAHSWLEELRLDAEYAQAQIDKGLGTPKLEQLVKDWAYIRKWAKIGDLAPNQPIPGASHELWARGTEAYVREGNAPSLELREIFARFKDWLVMIYESAKELVEITPQFRGVMDRLLATDKQIAEARDVAGIEAGAIPVEAMTKAEATALHKLKLDIKLEGEERVRKKAMREMVRERTDWWRAQKRQVAAEVADEVNARPEYRAATWLRSGQPPIEGVEHRRLDRDTLLRTYSPAMLQKLAFLWQAEGGLDPNLVAPLFGFTTGQEMIRAITEAPRKAQVVAEETDRRMLERHGDMLNDGSLAEHAAEAVNSEKQADVLLVEMRILKRMGAKNDLVPAARLREFAVRAIGRQPVGLLRPALYERTAGRAAYEAERAMIKKDYDLAFDAKLRQAANIYMFREALKQKQMVAKAIRKWKGLDKSDERLRTSRNIELVNAARALLGNRWSPRMTRKGTGPSPRCSRRWPFRPSRTRSLRSRSSTCCASPLTPCGRCRGCRTKLLSAGARKPCGLRWRI